MGKQKHEPGAYGVWAAIVLFLIVFWGFICMAFPGARELFAALWGFFRSVANF